MVRNVTAHMNVAEISKGYRVPDMLKVHAETGVVTSLQQPSADTHWPLAALGFWQKLGERSCEVIDFTFRIVETFYADSIKKAREGRLGGVAFVS